MNPHPTLYDKENFIKELESYIQAVHEQNIRCVSSFLESATPKLKKEINLIKKLEELYEMFQNAEDEGEKNWILELFSKEVGYKTTTVNENNMENEIQILKENTDVLYEQLQDEYRGIPRVCEYYHERYRYAGHKKSIVCGIQ